MPKLQYLDDEPIGDSFESFVEEKQAKHRILSMQTSAPVGELCELSIQSVLALFESRIGLSSDYLTPQQTEGAEVESAIQKFTTEPDNEALLAA